jgi:hypothetical protein
MGLGKVSNGYEIQPSAGDPDAPPEKLGAGLLITCNGEVLLLQRSSKHNFGTWGLPGGNADATDSDLLETARREATEVRAPGGASQLVASTNTPDG